jgi:hypothetical protein
MLRFFISKFANTSRLSPYAQLSAKLAVDETKYFPVYIASGSIRLEDILLRLPGEHFVSPTNHYFFEDFNKFSENWNSSMAYSWRLKDYSECEGHGERVAWLVSSIREFGLQGELLVRASARRGNWNLIDGHHRVIALYVMNHHPEEKVLIRARITV